MDASLHIVSNRAERMRRQERAMLQRMLDEQEKRLSEREARLKVDGGDGASRRE